MSKYAWIKPGVIARVAGGRQMAKVETSAGEVTVSYKAKLNDQVEVLSTYRRPNHQRLVRVKYLPPNWGEETLPAAGLVPLED